MSSKIPVIIFGDYISAYGAIRALSLHDVPIFMVSADGTGLALKSRFVRKWIRLSPADSAFVHNLDAWLQREVGDEVVLIVAGDDRYLEILSKRHAEFKTNLRLTFPDWTTVELVRKKAHTYRLASKLGIPIPRTYTIKDLDELKKLVSEKGDQLRFPLFMKAEKSERLLSKFGIKGVISYSVQELYSNYHKYENFFGELILQELIASEREIIKTVLLSLNKKSEPTGYIVNRKVRSGGEYLSGTFVVSDWSEELLQASVKLVKEIGYYGFASIQYKYDAADDTFKLLEINGRISMSNSMALLCGVNLPYLMYQEAVGEFLPSLTSFERGYSDKIIWWFVFADITAYLRFNRKTTGVREYLSSLMGRRYVLEPFCLRDPWPGIWFSFHILKRTFTPRFLVSLVRRFRG